MTPGFLYIMINDAMPNLVKVGMTTRSPWERAAELSQPTGVPSPFQVKRAFPVIDVEIAETRSHAILERQKRRHSADREFFECNSLNHILVEMLIEDDLRSADLLDRTMLVDTKETI
jgi:hypothetical protein